MAVSIARLTRPIDVVEAAYDMHGATEQWLRRLVRAVSFDLDAGSGVYGFVSTFDGDGLSVASPVVGRGVDEAHLALVPRINARPPPGVVDHMRARVVEFASFVQTFGGPTSAVARRFRAAVPRFHDSLGALAQDGESALLQFVATSSRLLHIDQRTVAAWRRVLLHVGTALRLRHRLERSAPVALLSSSAKLAHAEGDARGRTARDTLVEAVQRIERARGPRVRRDPGEALDLWQGLVMGRWSLVDHFESDGKRYIAAHENVPALHDPRGLTPWERVCLHYFLRGASTMEIAFSLGRSTSTVGKTLSSIARRLAFPNRAALRHVSEANVLGRLSLASGDSILDILVVSGVTVHPSWNDALGRAELDVARLAWEGLSDQEIAARRGVSPRTVSNQLRSIYRKVGVRNRSELIARLASSRSP